MIALDTNILVYADSPNDPLGRHERAIGLIEQLTLRGGIIPIQALGEFLNVCRQKKVLDAELAGIRIEAYSKVFDTPSTLITDLTSANRLLERYNLQYFDALILTVARRAGATMLLSEDMHDGLDAGGIRVVNPFVAENAEAIAAALGQAA